MASDHTGYHSMLSVLLDAVPATALTVDGNGDVSQIISSRRKDAAWMFAKGKNFARLLRLLFGKAAGPLLAACEAAARTGQPARVARFQHESVRGLTKYLSWSILPDADGTMVVCVLDVTESVCLEEEFSAVSQQNAAANRDLLAAMSKLDFRLMDLDQAHKKLSALYRITSVGQRTADEDEVLDEIVAGITGELGYACAAVLLLDEERQELVMKASRGYPPNVRLPYGKGITWHAVITREMVFVPDVSKDPRYIPAIGNGVSELAVPLICADKVIGVLDVETTAERPLHRYDRDLIGSLAGQVALAIAHAKHVARVEVQAVTDGLTGLYNYRYFLSLLDHEFKRAVRYSRPLSLILIDIDHFKRYNDNNGHSLGNEVLRQVAAIMRQACRDVDFAVRYGGEEFIVLLPETNLTDACSFAERLRTMIACQQFAGCEKQPGKTLTVSIGVSGFPFDASSDSELLEHADAALYLAKRTTRNCVMTYPVKQGGTGRPREIFG
ncbi:diguanylate cyclase [Anaeroselena agilis]|uniref:Sensor domain-containing diguanylate cyclase n=1 Tax=Anaeroselena agilis TaxID=3063788 RepID=A0ABU3NXA5_9FIRM|nr:sensor domain-containing diguanylate cyclase [Selenomonadales bacterium 4137-cl]